MATPTQIKRRGRLSLILGVLVAVAAIAAVSYAGEIQTDAVLSTDVLAPTQVSIGDNSFQIKVWAIGSIPGSSTGEAEIVNKYFMSTTGVITASTAVADRTTLTFANNKNYNQDPPCGPTQATSIQGCPNNPFIVNATLNVAAATPDNTTGTLTVSTIGSSGLQADQTPDTGLVQVDAGDTTAPTVLSVNRADASPTKASSVSWTVTFSESVTGVDTSDFALASSGVTGASVSSATGSGSSYTVAAGTGAGSGTLGLNLVDDDSIADAAANKLGGTGAGNGNFTGQVYTIDKTPPTFGCTPAGPDSSWHATDPSFSCTSADTGGSGSATPATFTLSTSVTNGTHDSNASTNTVTISDGVGNTTDAQFTGIMVDKRNPVTSYAQNPVANGAGWNKANVDVTLTATDNGGSGVNKVVYTTDGSEPTGSHGSVYGGVFTISTEGETTLKFRAIDNVGNAEDVQTKTIKIDKTPPTFGCTPAGPDSSWHATDPSFSCTGADTGSGVASPAGAFTLTTSVAGGTHNANASTNTVTVTDIAGNTTDAQFTGIMVDKKKPTFGDCTGGPFVLNTGSHTVSITASDNGGSGIDNGASQLTGSVLTSTIGGKDVTFTAVDNVVNTDTKTCTYQVNYNFIGFLSPLNPNPAVANVGTAGRTYPVKWQLTDGATPPNYITDAAGSTTVKVDKISCTTLSGDPTDPIDYAASTSAAGLRYDATANQYIYNWGSPSTKNACYRMTITTPDGQPHIALFQMK